MTTTENTITTYKQLGFHKTSDYSCPRKLAGNRCQGIPNAGATAT